MKTKRSVMKMKEAREVKLRKVCDWFFLNGFSQRNYSLICFIIYIYYLFLLIIFYLNLIVAKGTQKHCHVYKESNFFNKNFYQNNKNKLLSTRLPNGKIEKQFEWSFSHTKYSIFLICVWLDCVFTRRENMILVMWSTWWSILWPIWRSHVWSTICASN